MSVNAWITLLSSEAITVAGVIAALIKAYRTGKIVKAVSSVSHDHVEGQHVEGQR